MDKKESTRAEIDRLYRLYYQLDEEFESAKMKRNILTILVLPLYSFGFYGNLCPPLDGKFL